MSRWQKADKDLLLYIFNKQVRQAIYKRLQLNWEVWNSIQVKQANIFND